VPTATTQEKPPFIAPEGKSGLVQPIIKGPLPPLRGAVNVNRAKTVLNSSTAKSLAALQDALAKAPESARPAIINAIERIKKANEWSQRNLNEDPEDQGQDEKQENLIPRPNTLPVRPLPDAIKPNRDTEGRLIPADKPKYIPPLNNNLPRKNQLPLNKPVTQGTVIPGGINNQTVNTHK
jgi:outer membrane murein-binding lipoprotein Lpp